MTTSAASLETPARSIRVGVALQRLLGLSAGLYAALLIGYLVLRLVLADTVWWLALLHNFAPYYFVPLLILLPVLWLSGLRRVVVRLLPLLLIGGWLYGPRFLPKSAVSASAPSLKVVTFNIQFALGGFDPIVDWLAASDADLILLQEVGPENSARLFASLGDGYAYAVDLEGTTQAALSRVPLIQSERINLALTDADRRDLGNWYADRLVVEVMGEPLAVYNIHMPLPVRDTPHFAINIDHGLVQLAQRYDETRRNIFIRNLLTMLDEEPLPYLVAGDFNTSDNALIYGDLAARSQDSFREAASGLGATWPVHLPSVQPFLRIDYVWHSDGLRAVTAGTGPRLGSDHLPLVVTLATP